MALHGRAIRDHGVDATGITGRAASYVEAPVNEPVAGELLASRYRLEAKLGEGGQGTVFAAMDVQLGRRVAVKLLTSHQHTDRFRHEAALAKGLSHPNTVRLQDYGEDEAGRMFIVYELLNGRGLDAVLREGPMDEVRVAAIASGVLKSLMEAHAAGVVHRDIKPANIFLCDFHGETEFVKVLDFGIAKAAMAPAITQVDTAVGTPHYMPPEQLRGDAVTPATDLYALGMTMGEMLCGRRLVDGTSAYEVAQKQLSDAAVELPAAVLQSGLGPVVHRAVRKDPKARFDSAAAMLEAIGSADSRSRKAASAANAMHAAPTGVAIETPQAMTSASPARAASKSASSNRTVMFVLLAALAFIGLAVGSVVTLGVFGTSAAEKANRGDATQKKKRKKKGSAGEESEAPRIPVNWTTTKVVVTRVDDDDVEDVIGLCSSSGHIHPCAISGATFNPLWRAKEYPDAAGIPEDVVLTDEGVVVVTHDGIVHLFDVTTGKSIASIQAFLNPREVCVPREHPGSVWLFTVFGDRHQVMVDLAAKNAAAQERPASCPRAHGLYRTDQCADEPRDVKRWCTNIPLPGRIEGFNANWVAFDAEHGGVLGHHAGGAPYDMVAAYEVLPGFKGRVLWSRPFNDGDPAGPLSRNSQGFARVREKSLSIGGGRLLAVSASSVAAFDFETGKTLWRHPRDKADGVIARPDRVYVLSGNGVTVRAADTGKELARIGH
jgi:hypothetical protein